jgi:hypothetical protein
VIWCLCGGCRVRGWGLCCGGGGGGGGGGGVLGCVGPLCSASTQLYGGLRVCVCVCVTVPPYDCTHNTTQHTRNKTRARPSPGGTLLPYNLDEKRGWALSIDSLKASVAAARAAGKAVRGLVFINPGNPTGQCLSVDNLRELIKCAGRPGALGAAALALSDLG